MLWMGNLGADGMTRAPWLALFCEAQFFSVVT